MSAAIAQSVTQLTVSNTDAPWDFFSSAMRCANRSIKSGSMTKERQQLNRKNLITATCADFRNNHCAQFKQGERLPVEIFEQIENAVDTTIKGAIAQIHTGNVVSYKRHFVFKAKSLSYGSKITVVGEDVITLKEQAFAATLELNALEKKLTAQQQKPTPDLDKEAIIKENIQRREMARFFILDSIAKIEAAVKQ